MLLWKHKLHYVYYVLRFKIKHTYLNLCTLKFILFCVHYIFLLPCCDKKYINFQDFLKQTGITWQYEVSTVGSWNNILLLHPSPCVWKSALGFVNSYKGFYIDTEIAWKQKKCLLEMLESREYIVPCPNYETNKYCSFNNISICFVIIWQTVWYRCIEKQT